MKRKLLFFTAVAAASILVSCEGVDSIGEEVLLIPVKNGEEFQYIDTDGKIVINPQFKTATVFREGLALVETSGDNPQFGFINEDGKYAINAQYNQATIFSEGLAWVVSENSAPTAIDTEGQLKFTLQDAETVKIFKEGLAAFSIVNEEGEEKWGFVDKTGKVVINAQFSEVSNFSNEKCAVRNDDGKWGFIDKEGGIVINPQFDAATDFNNGKCVVTYSDKQGVIDIEGKYIINPQFSTMRIDGDLYLVNQDGKFGWCDNDGKLIINPQFSEALPFLGNKLTSVKSGESYGYIDKEGKYIINPQFELALPFNGSLALVTSAGKVGFIDVEGKYIINPQFDDVSLDFIVYKLTGESVFNTVSTGIEVPEDCIQAFVMALSNGDCDLALKLSTGSAAESVQSSIDAGCDEYQSEIVSVTCETTEDASACACTENRDGMDMTYDYDLKKVDGTWKVSAFNKQMDLGE